MVAIAGAGLAGGIVQIFALLILVLLIVCLVKAVSSLIRMADGIGKMGKTLDEIKRELEKMNERQ